MQKPDIAWKAASYTLAPDLLSPSILLIAVDCWSVIGGVCVSDDRTITAQKDEWPSRQQAPANRVHRMGTTQPSYQTQDIAVSAVHAEPGGSTTQSPQPPVAASARCGTLELCIAIASNHVSCGSEMFFVFCSSTLIFTSSAPT